ncbi:hypothetical protein AAC387_Pa11g0064 [Persea americana]
MASAIINQGEIAVPLHHAGRKKIKSSGLQRKVMLEEEVANLYKMLDYEEKVHAILERAFNGQVTSIPNFLPPKMKELLAELARVEEEIARLEREINNLQHSNGDEINSSEASKTKQWHEVNENNLAPRSQSPLRAPLMPPPSPSPRPNWVHQPHPSEARALFFINQAIKGNYTLSGFTRNEKLENSVGSFDEKERQREVGFSEKISKKSGIIDRAQSVPKLPPRHPRSKTTEHDSEISFSLLRNALLDSSSLEESTQKWQPNKLSESIMKCLICIFLRLMRTSRAIELEKSGTTSARSPHSSLGSRSFRSESNLKTSGLLSKEARQQDPYGILEVEDSLPRDIGPYKNYVRFTSNSLDVKSISSSIPLLRKLRALMNNLSFVELKSLSYQQKLAFWINMYNACIMHGFLQYGLPSSQEKLLELMNKAVLNIGGNKLNALAIEHFILRQPINSKEVYYKCEKNDGEDVISSTYGLEYPETNVMFSLSCGSRSSPAVRIYTADGISAELEKSKLEYLQASIVVTSTRRLMVPKLLLWNMPNFANDKDLLVEWVCNQLPTSGSLRKSMVECPRGPNNGRISNASIEIMPYEFEFQYLLASIP